MGYFKPFTVPFLTELRAKDCRSAKDWEYINEAGVWVEIGLTYPSVAKNSDGDIQETDRMMSFAEEIFKENLEVL